MVGTWLEDDAPLCDDNLGSGFGLVEETVGLNVTVRWGFAGTGLLVLDNDEIKGVVSLELEAMAVC